MSRTIYYFSGTGNSLAVARDISQRINGKLTPVFSTIQQDIVEVDGDTIGLVFPVYHQGLPLIISKFVEKLVNFEDKYIFGICTYGDSPGITLTYLNQLINARGGRLAAGFGVKMPYNYVAPSFSLKGLFKSFRLREIDMVNQQKMFTDWQRRRSSICKAIQSRQEGKIEVKAQAIESLVDSLNLRNTLQKTVWLKVAGFSGHTDLPFRESLQLMDCGFHFSDICTGCGICAKVCPVKNIALVDNRPVWQHHCEQCFACLHWCPKEAIYFGKGTSCGKRYHHPAVKLADMIRHNDR